MFSRSAAATAGLGLLWASAACAPDPVDPAAIQEWMTEQEAAEDGIADLLASMSSVAPAGADAEDSFVSVAFDTPAVVTGIEFSCFGGGAMRLQISARSGGAVTNTGSDPLECADSPHVVPPERLGDGAVDHVAVNGHGNDHDSAWHVTLSGHE